MALNMKFGPTLPLGVAVVGTVVVGPAPAKLATAPVTGLKELSAAEALAEELGTLWRVCVEHDMKGVMARIEQIKKRLQSIANDEMDAGAPAIFTGQDGTQVEFSPRGRTCEVTNPLGLVQHLSEKFGTEVAFGCVKVGLTELKKLMTEHEIEACEFVKVQDNAGPRTLKGVRFQEGVAA